MGMNESSAIEAVVPLDDTFLEALNGLSERQRRLVIGAVNYHALVYRGRRIELSVMLRPSRYGVVLTEEGTFRDQAAEHEELLTSTVFDALGPARGTRDPVRRVVAVNREVGDPSDVEIASATSLYWKLRGEAEHRMPLTYDALRQFLLRRRVEALGSRAIERAPENSAWERIRPAARGGVPAVIIAIHWFEMGGAERWAFETIRLAKEAGLLPIVISDRFSYHPWIDRPEIDGTVVLPLHHPLGAREERDGSSALLASLAQEYDLRGVLVHHNQWIYDRLAVLRRLVPGIPVIDTHHILEYSGGGYPASGVIVERFIDQHHVISPQLRDWLVDVQGIPEEKIVLAPLTGLTTEGAQRDEVQPRRDDATFTAGFIGRFARQKRPYLFLKLAHELVGRNRSTPFRFVVHGDGELADVIERLIKRYRLAAVLEVRSHRTPVAQTLADIDLLVLSSQNEGITLTTFEALVAGVPVLSTDVGSQRTLIPNDLLVPREPAGFTKEAAAAIRRLAGDENARADAWRREFERAQAFSKLESANSWAEGVFHQWSQ